MSPRAKPEFKDDDDISKYLRGFKVFAELKEALGPERARSVLAAIKTKQEKVGDGPRLSLEDIQMTR